MRHLGAHDMRECQAKEAPGALQLHKLQAGFNGYKNAIPTMMFLERTLIIKV